jgi:hypothetical protein
MKNLLSIWKKLQPGDVVLKQVCKGEDVYDKTELVVIVAVDIWDMAVAVYYTNYKEFNLFSDMEKEPKINSFGEWQEYWNVLGHWKKMPTFKQLLKAKRSEK